MTRLKLLVLLLTLIKSSDSLECYNGHDGDTDMKCDSTISCGKDEVCYKNLTNVGQVDFGCIDKTTCGTFVDNFNGVQPVSVSNVNGGQCFECCSNDYCNKNLCVYKDPSECVDDETVDCAFYNSLFHICKNVNQAKKYCANFCNLCLVVDGNWSLWSSWTDCDVTCENGTRLRSRTCSEPAPKYGGLECVGNSEEMKPCLKEMCPVHGGWSNWEQWNQCSKSCGVGMQARTRSCNNPEPDRFGNHCYGYGLENRLCILGPCANGGWADWQSWSSCSVSCDVGLRTRSRSCTNPPPSAYGHYCEGSSIEMNLCGGTKCDDCASANCGNGSCVDGLGDYTCVCNHGFTGVNCEQNIDDCASAICGNGSCVDRIGGYKCVCNAGFQGENCEQRKPWTDCYDIYHNYGRRTNGIYAIETWNTRQQVRVYCDMSTDGGGWTVFQKHRLKGSVNFTRTFRDYEDGFGNLNSEFWLGLNYIEEIAGQCETNLRIDLESVDGRQGFETFERFFLSPSPDYTLHLGATIDSLQISSNYNFAAYHKGSNFSTFDHDVDSSSSRNCAKEFYGGWWYNGCVYACLNGARNTVGFRYPSFATMPLKSSTMMMRRN